MAYFGNGASMSAAARRQLHQQMDHTDGTSDFVDALQIKETIMRRVNESMKDFKLTPTTDDNGISDMLQSLLPPIIGAVATSVSLAVSELMEKSFQRMEQRISTQKDPAMMASVRRLTYENDRLAQYTRRENVRVFGVKSKTDETPDDVEAEVLAVFRKTGTEIDKQDISVCHRVGKATKGTQPIIVRFISRRKRTEIMRKKKSLKSDTNKLFINDDLTPLRAKLLKYVKEQDVVDKAWTIDGRILCTRKCPPGLPPSTDRPRPTVIETPDDLFHLGLSEIDWNRLGLGHLAESC